MRTHANRGQSPLRLQVDASALHVLLIGRSHGQLQRRCSRRRSICPSALLTFDATDSCSRALDDISSYRCAPAYWRAVAGCSHPAVAASLLLAAAHLSGISEGDTVEDAAVLEQGKKLGSFAFGLPSEVSAARTWAQPTNMTHSPGSSSLCPINHTPADDAEASSSQCVLAARAPRLLLSLMREAAEEQLLRGFQAMHLLGPSWQNLPLVPSAATPTSSPAQEGHPTGSQTAHQSAEIAFHPLERSALTSAFRLMCGTCPRLRRASADALLAHSRRYDARGGDHGNGAGDLGMALSTTLLGSVHAAVALVRGASIVVQELLQRQRHSSGNQLLLHLHFQHALPPLKLLLQAAGDHELLSPLIHPLAVNLWKLLVGCLHQTLETPSHAHPALPSLFQVLPSAWYFLLLPPPDPNTVNPFISAALVEDQTLAFTATINSTLSDSDSDNTILDPRDIASWLPGLLDFGLKLQPGSLAVSEWLAALNVMVPLSRDYGAWTKEVMVAAARVLDFDSCLTTATRLQVAELLPEAAPGNMGQVMTRGGLQDLPSRGLASTAALLTSASSPATEVCDLCSESNSDNEDSGIFAVINRPTGNGNLTSPSQSQKPQPSHSPLSPQAPTRKTTPKKAKSPAKPGDFWRSLGGQRQGTLTWEHAKPREPSAVASTAAGASEKSDSQLPLQQWWSKSHQQRQQGQVQSSSLSETVGGASGRNDALLMPPPSSGMRGATASAVAAVARQAAAEAAARRAEEGTEPASVFDHGNGSGGGGGHQDDTVDGIPLARRLALLRSALKFNSSAVPSFKRPGFLSRSLNDTDTTATAPVNIASGVWTLDRLASALPPGSTKPPAPANRLQPPPTLGGKRLTSAAGSLLREIQESNAGSGPATAAPGTFTGSNSSSDWHSISDRSSYSYQAPQPHWSSGVNGWSPASSHSHHANPAPLHVPGVAASTKPYTTALSRAPQPNLQPVLMDMDELFSAFPGEGSRPAGGSTVGGRMKVSLMDALGGNGKTGAARHTMLVDPTHTALAVAAAARNVRAVPARPVAPPLKMDDIHREVISWGVPGLLSGSRSSPAGGVGLRTGGVHSPTHGTRRTFGGGGAGGGGERLSSVPLRFTSLDHYARTFRPLLMEELRAGVLSSVEESGGAGPPVSVGVTLSELMRTDEHSHNLTFLVSQDPSESQNHQRGGPGGGGSSSKTDSRFGNTPMVRSDDLVLLSRGRITSLSSGKGSRLTLPDPCLLLLITETSMEMGVRVVKAKGRTSALSIQNSATAIASVGGTEPLVSGASLLQLRSSWRMTVLHSLVPNFRELQALCHLSSIPPTLRSFILNPSAGSSSDPTHASNNPDPADVDLAQSSQAPPPASQLHNPPPRNSNTLLGNRTGSDLSKQAEDGVVAVAKRSAAAAVAWKACPAPLALKKGLEVAYNESQLAAVASALDESSPISLVQGPPGSGKTSAIIGILSMLLVKPFLALQQQDRNSLEAAASSLSRGINKAVALGQLQHGAAAAAANSSAGGKKASAAARRSKAAAVVSDVIIPTAPAAADVNGLQKANTGAAGSGAVAAPVGSSLDALQLGVVPPVRILVCAQSNAAIDELLSRLSREGVWCMDGSRRAPAMVRMGRADVTHADVLPLHVDALARALCGGSKAVTDAAAECEEAQVEAGESKTTLAKVMQDIAALEVRQQKAMAAHNKAADLLTADPEGDCAMDFVMEMGTSATADAFKNMAATNGRPPANVSISTLNKKVPEGGIKTSGKLPSRKRVGEASAVHREELHGSSDSDMSMEEEREGREHTKEQKPSPSVTRSSPSPAAEGVAQNTNLVAPGDPHKRGSESVSDDSSLQPRKRSRWGAALAAADPVAATSVPDNAAAAISVPGSAAGTAVPVDTLAFLKPRVLGGVATQARPSGARSVQRYQEPSKVNHTPDPKGLKGVQRQQRGETEGGDGRMDSAAAAVGSAAADTEARGTEEGHCEDLAALAMQLRALREQKAQLGAALRAAERTTRNSSHALDRAKRGVRAAVASAAEIVACTLSSSGGDLLSAWPPGTAPRFDALVIDEAAQALEPAALIPLQLLRPGAKILLVGDPLQLPPTVLSRVAETAKLSQSMFERLQRAGCPATLLSQQYRMHPDISSFPAAYFYKRQLVDGAGINASSRHAPFHTHPLLGPFVVFDCAEGQERGGGGGSLCNRAEADLAAALYAGLLRHYPRFTGSVAVITPYRAQLSTLRAAFRSVTQGGSSSASDPLSRVEFGTVDGFQGREADVVIFSCVRARGPGGREQCRDGGGLELGASPGLSNQGKASLGFLNDVRRMNVGLTRARRSLWLIGHMSTLATSAPWTALLRHATSNSSMYRTSAAAIRPMLAAPPSATQLTHVRVTLEDVDLAHGGAAITRKPLIDTAAVRQTAVEPRFHVASEEITLQSAIKPETEVRPAAVAVTTAVGNATAPKGGGINLARPNKRPLPAHESPTGEALKRESSGAVAQTGPAVAASNNLQSSSPVPAVAATSIAATPPARPDIKSDKLQERPQAQRADAPILQHPHRAVGIPDGSRLAAAVPAGRPALGASPDSIREHAATHAPKAAPVELSHHLQLSPGLAAVGDSSAGNAQTDKSGGVRQYKTPSARKRPVTASQPAPTMTRDANTPAVAMQLAPLADDASCVVQFPPPPVVVQQLSVRPPPGAGRLLSAAQESAKLQDCIQQAQLQPVISGKQITGNPTNHSLERGPPPQPSTITPACEIDSNKQQGGQDRRHGGHSSRSEEEERQHRQRVKDRERDRQGRPREDEEARRLRHEREREARHELQRREKRERHEQERAARGRGGGGDTKPVVGLVQQEAHHDSRQGEVDIHASHHQQQQQQQRQLQRLQEVSGLAEHTQRHPQSADSNRPGQKRDDREQQDRRPSEIKTDRHSGHARHMPSDDSQHHHHHHHHHGADPSHHQHQTQKPASVRVGGQSSHAAGPNVQGRSRELAGGTDLLPAHAGQRPVPDPGKVVTAVVGVPVVGVVTSIGSSKTHSVARLPMKQH